MQSQYENGYRFQWFPTGLSFKGISTAICISVYFKLSHWLIMSPACLVPKIPAVNFTARVLLARQISTELRVVRLPILYCENAPLVAPMTNIDLLHC
jgi:hypothetical protein